MEKDDEVKGGGNSYDFGARMYDARVGRFLSLDAYMSKFPNASPYSAFENSPLITVDLDGHKPVDPPDGKFYIFKVWYDENNEKHVKNLGVQTVKGLKSDIIKVIYASSENASPKIVDYYLRNPDGKKAGPALTNIEIDKKPDLQYLNWYFGSNIPKVEIEKEKPLFYGTPLSDTYYEGPDDPCSTGNNSSNEQAPEWIKAAVLKVKPLMLVNEAKKIFTGEDIFHEPVDSNEEIENSTDPKDMIKGKVPSKNKASIDFENNVDKLFDIQEFIENATKSNNSEDDSKKQPIIQTIKQ